MTISNLFGVFNVQAKYLLFFFHRFELMKLEANKKIDIPQLRRQQQWLKTFCEMTMDPGACSSHQTASIVSKFIKPSIHPKSFEIELKHGT